MRKSKARLVIELVGASEKVDEWVSELMASIRVVMEHSGLQANFPEPCRIVPILRNRKKAAPKPERKARKANSQQPEALSPVAPDILDRHPS